MLLRPKLKQFSKIYLKFSFLSDLNPEIIPLSLKKMCINLVASKKTRELLQIILGFKILFVSRFYSRHKNSKNNKTEKQSKLKVGLSESSVQYGSGTATKSKTNTKIWECRKSNGIMSCSNKS